MLFPVQKLGFADETCTANLTMSGKNAFPPEKMLFRAVSRIDAAGAAWYIDFRDRILVLPRGISMADGSS